MKRKPHPKAEPVVPPAILDQALKSAAADRIGKPSRCVVCGSPAAIEIAEPLCWVCRRLKISAWGDSEQQLPVQE